MTPTASDGPGGQDVRPARLTPDQYAQNFCDAHPPLTLAQARIEADRCYYCYEAPCQTACPTGIDVPSFIQRIADGNIRGSAHAILSANPLGGMCARVCPTEVLCEQACVRNTHEDKPVEIGQLQRYATDAYFARPGAPLFTRAPATGRRVAVVGAGPAGLACAHGLARLGHEVVVLDANTKPGGLNEYGLATYKTVDDFAQKEVAWLLSIGGIEIRHNTHVGRDVSLETLASDFDAVFLGLGLAGVNAIGIAEPAVQGLRNAVEFIAQLRQASDYATVPVGRRVLVIGGGMTAVDAAVQSRKLGADEVTMVYRRGPQDMSASGHEQEWADPRCHHPPLGRPQGSAGRKRPCDRHAFCRHPGRQRQAGGDRRDLHAGRRQRPQGHWAELHAVAAAGAGGAGRRPYPHRRRRTHLPPQGMGRR
jgi:glutamate synthase (NADPH/NADH) small chain